MKRSVQPFCFWGEHSKGLSNQADVELDMINAISAANIAFIMSSSQAIVNWLNALDQSDFSSWVWCIIIAFHYQAGTVFISEILSLLPCRLSFGPKLNWWLVKTKFALKPAEFWELAVFTVASLADVLRFVTRSSPRTPSAQLSDHFRSLTVSLCFGRTNRESVVIGMSGWQLSVSFAMCFKICSFLWH